MQASPAGESDRSYLALSKVYSCWESVKRELREDGAGDREWNRKGKVAGPPGRRALTLHPARAGLRDAYLCVGVLADVNALNEAHFAIGQLHNERSGANAIAEKAHALEQRAVGDAGGGKH